MDLRLYDPATGATATVNLDAAAAVGAAVGAPTVVSAQLLDVSNFQGKFPWAQVKAGYPALAGGIYKMTEGLGFTDADAQWNHDQIKNLGMHHGAYHFGHPGSSAAQQAQFFVAQHQKIGMTGTDMLWLDHEVTDGQSPAAVSAWASAFMNELHTLCPHNPMGVYTFVNFIQTGNCHGLGKWPLWLAFPASAAPVPPPPWSRWTFWQWGTRRGIDADAFNGTATDLTKWISSFKPAPAPVPQPPPPAGGPVRRLLAPGETLASVAPTRNTTEAHLLAVTQSNLTVADVNKAGFYYTTN